MRGAPRTARVRNYGRSGRHWVWARDRAQVTPPGHGFVGEQRELAFADERPGEQSAYTRLLGDAMAGEGALFTREDAVEAAWAAVGPILKVHPRAIRYKRGEWGPREADALIAGDGGWWDDPGAETA